MGSRSNPSLIGWFPSGYIGDALYEAQTRELIDNDRCKGWVQLEERCPAETVSKYLHASDVVALPFVRGARPNNGTVLAAVLHEWPVLTTEGIDTPEEFGEKYGVSLVPAGNSDALYMRLKELVLSESLKANCKERQPRRPSIFPGRVLAEEDCELLFFKSSLKSKTRLASS